MTLSVSRAIFTAKQGGDMERRLKIFAVDDDSGILALLRGLLEDSFDYFGTTDPEEAKWHFIEHHDVDVFLVDMMLGHKIEIAMRLVYDLRRAGFQGFIVILSACPPESNGWQLLLRVGANDMLEKCSDIGKNLSLTLEKAKNFNRNIYPPEQIC